MRKSMIAYPVAVSLLTGVAFAVLVHPVSGGPVPGDRVPGGLTLPWMWQATVQQDPPGPASVLVGGDSVGFEGTDLFDSEGKVAAVGRGGDYRMLRYSGWNGVTPGEDVLLSPDGRYAAQEWLEGSTSDGDGLDIVDLATGRSVTYDGGLTRISDQWGNATVPCCAPAAWAPDGRSLLVETFGTDYEDPQTSIIQARRRLGLLDLATNRITPIGAERPGGAVRKASRGAFAPDGRHLAVTAGDRLELIDRTGKVGWTTDLGDRRHLAGAGAFSPDGSRIAVAELDGCLDACDRAALATRRWRISYLDAATGRPADGPDLPVVTAMSVRALGWTAGGELVVTRHEPERDARKRPDQEWSDTGWEQTGHITLVALGAGGAVRTLLDPPADVLTLDVAADLIRAGRFGGPTPVAGAFPARPIIGFALVPVALLAAAALLVVRLVTRLVVRRRRREPPRPMLITG
ncbi:hypothetical protein [Actinoplanes teichomyceticus]|uniref:hypothetical protein n=1 Tax=Actinoplanes teichomyceticus TaxID=1867 RepID=UPI0011A0B1AD|nr:hypothetical protein [Actinoplanes teichomyceticus]